MLANVGDFVTLDANIMKALTDAAVDNEYMSGEFMRTDRRDSEKGRRLTGRQMLLLVYLEH